MIDMQTECLGHILQTEDFVKDYAKRILNIDSIKRIQGMYSVNSTDLHIDDSTTLSSKRSC